MLCPFSLSYYSSRVQLGNFSGLFFFVKGAVRPLVLCYFKIFLASFFPSRYDFYLCSQSVRQGTVTPTHFNIVVDKSRLSVDNIQVFTYKLCHMYYNWPVSVTHIRYHSLFAPFLLPVFVPSHFVSHTLVFFSFQGTVRVPAPCQYAHKLAFLLGQLIHTNPSDKMCDSLFFL